LSPNSNGALALRVGELHHLECTHGATGSLGGVPGPMTPAPCGAGAAARLMISGSLSKRT
jgi:hypothetical protein